MALLNTLFFSILVPVAAAVLLYQLDSFDPAPLPLHELSEQVAAAPRRNGHMLKGSEFLGVGTLAGPEDVAYDSKSGLIYTGCADGWIKRVKLNESADDSVVENWVNTGGRPLGLAHEHDGKLLVADAEKNLLEPQGRKITFISDRGVGLLSAFDKIFPGNPHLFCYKHLVHNLMTKYNGKGSSVLKDDVKKKFFELAYSCTEKEYRFHLRELREAGGADIIDPFLADLPVQNWCRAFFPGCRYGIMANSIAESFNAWFAVEREMPVYTMLDQTRIRVMQMMGERRDEAQLWTSQLTPVMEGRLKEGMEKACRFNVHYSHTNVYEVRSKYSYVVDLGTPSCSCKKWEINCFPCCHGLAAIQAASLDVYAFIDKHFHVDYCQKCYDFPIYPISNVDMASSESSSSGFILPPNAKRPPGRPRLKRFKSRGECEKKLIRCSRCGKMGQHNKKTCTEPI